MGEEVFLAAEDPENNVLVGLIRMRVPSLHAHLWEIDGRTAIIRELHVYGPEVPVGGYDEEAWQHKGWGSKLLREAERIALEEYDETKMLILSGVGAREYYRKHGYTRLKNSPYMAKNL
jgi:elongator complex protein 3